MNPPLGDEGASRELDVGSCLADGTVAPAQAARPPA
jgi:hypothetical protein